MSDNTLLKSLRLVTVEHIGNDKIITEAKEEFCKPEGHIVPPAAGAAEGGSDGETPAPEADTEAAKAEAAKVADGEAAAEPVVGDNPEDAAASATEGATKGGRRSRRRRQKKSAKKSKKGGRSRKNSSKNRRKLSRRR